MLEPLPLLSQRTRCKPAEGAASEKTLDLGRVVGERLPLAEAAEEGLGLGANQLLEVRAGPDVAFADALGPREDSNRVSGTC